MKKCIMFFSAMLCSALFSVNAFAQLDDREPGIYTMVYGESIPLKSSNGINGVARTFCTFFRYGEAARGAMGAGVYVTEALFSASVSRTHPQTHPRSQPA